MFCVYVVLYVHACLVPFFARIGRPADREADPELAAACRRCSPEEAEADAAQQDGGEFDDGKGGIINCSTEGACDAVLSNDSDFLVMDIPG